MSTLCSVHGRRPDGEQICRICTAFQTIDRLDPPEHPPVTQQTHIAEQILRNPEPGGTVAYDESEREPTRMQVYEVREFDSINELQEYKRIIEDQFIAPRRYEGERLVAGMFKLPARIEPPVSNTEYTTRQFRDASSMNIDGLEFPSEEPGAGNALDRLAHEYHALTGKENFDITLSKTPGHDVWSIVVLPR